MDQVGAVYVSHSWQIPVQQCLFNLIDDRPYLVQEAPFPALLVQIDHLLDILTDILLRYIQRRVL
jgi:hypothetical protein